MLEAIKETITFERKYHMHYFSVQSLKRIIELHPNEFLFKETSYDIFNCIVIEVMIINRDNHIILSRVTIRPSKGFQFTNELKSKCIQQAKRSAKRIYKRKLIELI